MNTHYHMTIAGCERDLPICPLNDKLSIGAFVIFGDCELTQACATEQGLEEFDRQVCRSAAQKSAGV